MLIGCMIYQSRIRSDVIIDDTEKTSSRGRSSNQNTNYLKDSRAFDPKS